MPDFHGDDCDFFKLVNSKLFLTKLSGTDLYENVVDWCKGQGFPQPIWLSGSPIKGHFRAKKAKHVQQSNL